MMPPYRRYLLAFLASFLVTCPLVAAFNVAVDPYGLFGVPRTPGFNAVKSAGRNQIRFVKPYMAERVAARTLISGNSRAEMGLDPASACWDAEEGPVFNTAVPNLGVEDQIAYLEHAASKGGVRQAIVTLDFLDFLGVSNVPEEDGQRGAPTGNLRVDDQGRRKPGFELRRLKDWLTGAFSLNTLIDSVKTVLAQGLTGLTDRRDDGFNPAQDYVPIIHNEGQGVLFAQKGPQLRRQLARPGLTAFPLRGGAWSQELEALEQFLGRAQARGLAVKLAINPAHIDQLAAIRRFGLWDDLEAWKRATLTLAERHGATLFDFTSVGPLTTEAPPPRNNRTQQLHWFWEPSHYRSELGELMLATLLGRPCADRQGLPPFGVRLTPAGLDGHLAALRTDLDAYLAAHPELSKPLGGR